MLSTLTIRDEILSASGNPDPDFTLVFYSEFITVRELIQARVKHEVDTYNQTQPEHFRGFVQPSETEQTLNGFRMLKRRLIDWEDQYSKAVTAFQRNGFIILVDEQQAENLDDLIRVRPETIVTFLKLVPLVGG